MTDSPELAAIRARVNEPRFASYGMLDDCRALLRMLDEALAERDEAREGDEESSKLMAHYRDHCLRLEKERDEARADYQRLATRLNDEAKAEKEHCKDCCCARSWRALGISEYTGKSIPEHIEALRAEIERLREAMERGSDG